MMIALPGLTLVTGRTDVAKSILLAFARHADRGMRPGCTCIDRVGRDLLTVILGAAVALTIRPTADRLM